MKTTLTVLLLMWLPVSLMAGTSPIADNPPCIDGPNTIEQGGQYTFTANAAAQCSNCYDWDISGLSGSIASIVGSDDGSTVVVDALATGTFSLDLTFFTETGCFTCTKSITIVQEEIDCANCEVTIAVETIQDECISATANLVGCDNPSYNPIVDVDWSWGLAGTSCAAPPFDCDIPDGPDMFETTIPIGTIYGNPPPFHYLQFYAVVTYQDGTVCDYAWGQYELTCVDNYEDPAPGKLNLYPNPNSKGAPAYFEGIEANAFQRIQILDLNGFMKSSFSPVNNTINTEDLTEGIYLVQFVMHDGQTISKKLVIQ